MALYLRLKNIIIKLIYRAIGRRFWRKPGIYQIHGGHAYLDPRDGLSAWKRRFNVWEPMFFHKLDRYIDEDEKILEFGSCFGDTSVRLLSNAPNGHLLGIEPFPRYFDITQKTQAANPQFNDRLRFINIAYSRDRSHFDFTNDVNPYADLSSLNGYDYGNRVTGSKQQTTKRIPALSLKKILRQYNFAPTMIFMDIEGAEMDVLHEMLDIGIRPKLAWEHHAYAYGQDKLEELLNQLRQAGYSVTYLDHDHLICLNSR